MIAQPQDEYRDRRDIIADLEQLTQEDGFIYTFCLLVLKHQWNSYEDAGELRDWSRHLSIKELSFLLGLMVKYPLKTDSVPSEEVAQVQDTRAFELLGELHRSYGRLFNNAMKELASSEDGSIHSNQAQRDWLESGDRVVEPMFYGGDGAYDFQYIEITKKRYANDVEWLDSYIGTSFESILKIPKILENLSKTRLQSLGASETFEEFCEQCLSAFTFVPEDISGLQEGSVSEFIEIFACTPGHINQEFDSLGAYNAAISHPFIRLSKDRYFLPIAFSLTQSIYESPLYWILVDPDYRETGLTNRGEATEQIAYEMLVGVFGHQNVFQGVTVWKGKDVATDIDVLAVAGNKAVIVQVKSKKLTELSKRGDVESLKGDFREAIQKAYDQGLICRSAVIEKTNLLKDCLGQTIQLHEDINDAYLICLTGDHYPAVILQVEEYLCKQEIDPYPLAMSVFDLDILSFYLKDPFDFLYYLRQRSTFQQEFKSDSEMSFLAFHLSNKLFPDNGVEFISPSFAQLIDANYLVAKGHHPRTKTADNLFHDWRNEAFDELVDSIKATEIPGFTDALFFLFDLASDTVDEIIKVMLSRKDLALMDGDVHSASFPIGDRKRGISFLIYPQVFDSIEEQFSGFAQAVQYKHRADEWLTLGSIGGSTELVDMFFYSRESWRYDPHLERFVSLTLKPGTMVNSDRQKIGRNEPCYCGSGRKFKKCHGK